MSATASSRPRRPPVDERILARRRSVRQDEARRRRRWTLSIVAIVVLVAGAFAVSRSPLFAITEVRITGAPTAADADLVRTAAAITPGENLVGVDLAAAAGRVESIAWVRTAALERVLPSTVEVTVTPRVPAVVVLVGGDAWLVDDAGVVVGGGARDGLPVVDAPASVLPGVGVEASDAAVRAALDVHRALPAELAARVTRYEAPSERGLRLLVDDLWVRVGAAERVEDKAAVLQALLAQIRDQRERAAAEGGSGPQVAEIDVRAPDNPVIVPGGTSPGSAPSP